VAVRLHPSVTVIGDHYFSGCGSLPSITFQPGSQLSQFVADQFSGSGLILIHFPASVTVIGELQWKR
jgi:hypothetical protein